MKFNSSKLARTTFSILVLAVFFLTAFAIPSGTAEASSPDIPRPITPSNMTTDNTPMYKWSRVQGATMYRFEVFKGEETTPLFTVEVTDPTCNLSYCKFTPTTKLLPISYTWHVQAYIKDEWKEYSYLKKFYVVRPLLVEPKGEITDTTPTFVWTKVEKAVRYRLQIFRQGETKFFHSRIIPAENCDEIYCYYDLPFELAPLTYRWKVQAYLGEYWRPYSRLMWFKLVPPTQ